MAESHTGKDIIRNQEESSVRLDQMLNIERHTSSTQDRSSQVPEIHLDIEQLQAPPTTTVLPPIQFPIFTGDNFSIWLYKCNQFFQIYKNVPDEDKVRLTSIYMEGDALRWHQKFTQKIGTSQFSWKEYVTEMGIRFGNQASSKIASTDVAESTKNKKETERTSAGPSICRLQIMDMDDSISGGQAAAALSLVPHIRFGPVYHTINQVQDASDRAWEAVLKNSPNRPAVTTESYLSAVRNVYKEARRCYKKHVTDSFTGTQFRWMMIKDGCFFLQLTLFLLGGSKELGLDYSPLDDKSTFGRSSIHSNSSCRPYPRYRDFKKYTDAMFFVGNQIPFVVLKVLLKQDYFQMVIKKVKWERPLDMFQKVLYELLLFPEIEAQRCGLCRGIKGLWRTIVPSRVKWLQQQKPIDLLHGFQLLILGPESRSNNNNVEEEEEEDDIEDDTSGMMQDDITSHPATQLHQSGIHFWNCQRICRDPFWSCCCIGSRRISFCNSMLCCYGCAILCFPPIVMADDTEFMFRSLRDYETSQELMSTRKREVCSYIRFMSELIKTPEDARIMASNSIILGNKKQKHKLPGILRDLTSKGADNHNIRRVKVEITDYSPPIWKKYWQVLGLGFVIAVVQTLLALLDFLGKSKKK